MDHLLTYGWIGFAAALWIALCIGSFLNVVIYRLPVMLNREWQASAREILGDEILKQIVRLSSHHTILIHDKGWNRGYPQFLGFFPILVHGIFELSIIQDIFSGFG